MLLRNRRIGRRARSFTRAPSLARTLRFFNGGVGFWSRSALALFPIGLLLINGSFTRTHPHPPLWRRVSLFIRMIVIRCRR